MPKDIDFIEENLSLCNMLIMVIFLSFLVLPSSKQLQVTSLNKRSDAPYTRIADLVWNPNIIHLKFSLPKKISTFPKNGYGVPSEFFLPHFMYFYYKVK
jgi:hypothetical protein